MLEFRILGPLELVKDGERLEVAGRNQRAVLMLLLLDAGRVVSTDRLLDKIWGENPPRTAATSLQNSISQLRKLLGPDVIATRPPGYQLEIGSGELDLDRFTNLVDEAKAAPAAERAAKLREALALWRGTPLADFAYEAFAEPEIARLEELRLAVLEERIEADLESERHAEVVGELESLVDENPLRERLRELSMRALYLCGRQAEALQVYHDARRVLVDDLGIEPTRRLQELHAAILRQDSALDAASAEPKPSQNQFEEVAATILAGRVVPVLGADVAELTASLATRFEYPAPDEVAALPRIAQYVATMKGSGPLYDELHARFEEGLPPAPLHRFLAALPPLLRERGVPHQLIVTTNYDLALERAFLDAGEEFDSVSYLAAGRDRGKFCHVGPDGKGTLVESPNTYATELSLERRTIILRLHGQVDPTPERRWESFVVTEDDYIDYLAQSDVATMVPVGLAATLRRSHFLFFGYSLADWNLRLLLHRLWGDQPLGYRSWALGPDPTPLEREFWRRRDVDALDVELDRWAEAFARHVGLDFEQATA